MADPTIKTAGMTDKAAKNVWYKALGGLSVWQVSPVHAAAIILQVFLPSCIPLLQFSRVLYACFEQGILCLQTTLNPSHLCMHVLCQYLFSAEPLVDLLAHSHFAGA
jgi:hypothetical protein